MTEQALIIAILAILATIGNMGMIYYYQKCQNMLNMKDEVVDNIINNMMGTLKEKIPESVIPIEARIKNRKGYLKNIRTNHEVCFTEEIPCRSISEIEHTQDLHGYPTFRILWNPNEKEKKGLATMFQLRNDETEIKVVRTDIVNIVDAE